MSMRVTERPIQCNYMAVLIFDRYKRWAYIVGKSKVMLHCCLYKVMANLIPLLKQPACPSQMLFGLSFSFNRILFM